MRLFFQRIVRSPYILSLFLAFSGIGYLRWTTGSGIGLFSDSITYIGGARNIIESVGYKLRDPFGNLFPIVDFPPGYSALIALSGRVIPNILEATRWLQCLLFGLNIFLVSCVIQQASKRYSWASSVGALLFMFSVDQLAVHSVAWSEDAFISFSLIVFLFLSQFLETERWLFLGGACMAAAAACLIRLAGLAWILSGVVTLLALSRTKPVSKAFRTLIFGVSAALPLVIWYLFNWMTVRKLSNRAFSFHPPFTPLHSRAILHALTLWFTQSSLSAWIAIPLDMIGIVLLIMMVIKAWRNDRKGLSSPVVLLLIAAVSYGIFIFAVNTFIQADLLIDAVRILAPLHVVLLCAFAGIALNVMPPKSRIFGGFLLAGGVFFIIRGVMFAYDIHRGDQPGYASRGYAQLRWKRSQVLIQLERLPANVLIYSNLPWPIDIYVGRSSLGIEGKTSLVTSKPNPLYKQSLIIMKNRVENGEAVIAYLTGSDGRDVPKLEELRSLITMNCNEIEGDGAICSGQPH